MFLCDTPVRKSFFARAAEMNFFPCVSRKFRRVASSYSFLTEETP